MATEIERLVVSLEGRITNYERAMQKALGRTNTTARQIESRFSKMSGTINSAFTKVAATYISAQGIRGAAELIDASIRVQNSLKVAGLEGENLTQVYDALFASAQRNATPIESLATLYGRASTNAKELGATQQDLVRFTDVVAMSLKAGGTSAQEASGALLQLGQALGGSKIQAEEYNSLIDGARPLLQAVAAGMDEAGGSVGKLTALVKAGKVSNKAFFDAALAGSNVLGDQLAGSELTASAALVRLQNVLQDVVGKFNSGTNAANDFITVTDAFADSIERASRGQGKLGQTITQDQSDLERLGQIIQAIGERFDAGAAASREAGSAFGGAAAALFDFAKGAAEANSFADATQTSLLQLINGLVMGTTSADDAKVALQKLAELDPKFIVVGELNGLIDVLELTRQKADAVRSALAFDDVGKGPGSFSDLQTQFGAPKPKVSLKDPRYHVTTPTSGSGGSKKTGAEKFSDSLQRVRDQIKATERETTAVGYNTAAKETARVQEELLNDARDSGVKLTPAIIQSIDQTATAYGVAAQASEDASKAQDTLTNGLEAFKSTAADSLKGFITDLVQGKSAAEALGNVLGNLGDKLLDAGLTGLVNAAFPSAGAGSGIGSLLGQLFGGGRATGGPVEAGKFYRVNENTPNSEFFAPAQNGYIMPSLPSQSARSGNGQVSVNFAPVIDARGMHPADLEARLRGLVRYEVPAAVKKAMKDPRSVG